MLGFLNNSIVSRLAVGVGVLAVGTGVLVAAGRPGGSQGAARPPVVQPAQPSKPAKPAPPKPAPPKEKNPEDLRLKQILLETGTSIAQQYTDLIAAIMDGSLSEPDDVPAIAQSILRLSITDLNVTPQKVRRYQDGSMTAQIRIQWKTFGIKEMGPDVQGLLTVNAQGWRYVHEKALNPAGEVLEILMRYGGQIVFTGFGSPQIQPPTIAGSNDGGPVVKPGSKGQLWEIAPGVKVAVHVVKFSAGDKAVDQNAAEFAATARSTPDENLHVLDGKQRFLLLEPGDAVLFRIESQNRFEYVWLTRDQQGKVQSSDGSKSKRLNLGERRIFNGSVQGVDWSLELVRPTANQDSKGREVDYTLKVTKKA